MSRNVLLKLFLFGLISIPAVSAHDIYNSIKQETAQLFIEKLGVGKDELHISFNRLPDNLEKYKNCQVDVYSQKRVLKPGSQSVWLRLSNENKILKKVPVNITVNVIKDVVVARDPINRNNVLSAGNLKMESKQLGRDWDQYFFSLNDLIGNESKRQIKKGASVLKRMVRANQMVHSGQEINVQLRSDHFTISTKGTAKENGAYGDEIKLKLDDSGKTIRGIVSSENLVIVSQE